MCHQTNKRFKNSAQMLSFIRVFSSAYNNSIRIIYLPLEKNAPREAKKTRINGRKRRSCQELYGMHISVARNFPALSSRVFSQLAKTN